MKAINTYLNFPGNTEEAFNFYKSVFGGEFSTIMRFKDMPGANNIPAAEANKIMHISLPLGKGYVLMGSDSLEDYGKKLIMGNNSYICISPESEEEINKLFKALSDGGEVEMPLEKTFWGSYFASFKDKFGVYWMLDYQLPKQ